MGGPKDSKEVESFLYNLFSDPYIIQLPFWLKPFQKLLAKLIASNRKNKIIDNYSKIGGGSPILFETEAQAKALAKKTKLKVFIAMRYSKPFLKDCIKELKSFDSLTVIPLYPQYSIATSGSSIAECQKLFKKHKLKAKVKYINDWYQEKPFIKLIQQRISDAIQGLDDPYILFSAHGLPVSYIKNGDPYQKQIERSIELIMKESKFSSLAHSISYQSRVGPVEWLKPYTDEIIIKLGKEGVKNLIVVPISFVGDHIETLEEIGIQYRELAIENGIINFRVTRLPKANPLLIETLANLIR